MIPLSLNQEEGMLITTPKAPTIAVIFVSYSLLSATYEFDKDLVQYAMDRISTQNL